jgi:hypothetical protein
MPLIQAFQNRFALNHIGQVEQTYQTRMLGRRRGWFGWLWRRTVDLALIVAIFLALLASVGVLLWVNIQPFLSTIPLLIIFPPIVAVIVHFSLIIRALAYSTNSIAREQQGQSWDLLVLTGVDARQIVMGKWVATVRSLWPTFLRLGLLRACVVIFIGVTIVNPMTYGYYGNMAEFRLIVPNLFHFGVILAFIPLVTICNLLFTAACGVSASARHRSAGVALARGIGIRLGIIALFMIGLALFVFMVTRMLFSTYDYDSFPFQFVSDLSLFGLGSVGSLLDNGAVMGITYLTTRAEYGSSYNYRYHVLLVLSMVTLALLYLGLTRLLLGRTVRYLVKQGVLPAEPRRAAATPAPLETTPSPMV